MAERKPGPKDSKKAHVWNVRAYKDGRGRVITESRVSRHVQTCKEIEVSDSLDPQEGELGPLDFDDEASGRNLEVIASSDPQEEGALKVNKGLEEALSFAIATAAERARQARKSAGGGRKGTPGKLRQALIAISEAIHSKDPEKILDAMEDENLVEDLYGAAPKPKINIHLFQINRVERTVDFTRRDGKDVTRSLKTVENLIAKL